KVGAVAMRALEEYAPQPAALGEAVGIGDHPALGTIHTRVIEKLRREPVEDYRVDFEDGYGNRGGATEDGAARAVAEAFAEGMRRGTLSPFIGIRVKPFNEEMRGRSQRTLEIVLTTLMERAW